MGIIIDIIVDSTGKIKSLILQEKRIKKFKSLDEYEVTWNEIIKRNKSIQYSNEPLAQRENYIAKIRTKGGIQGIQKIIASNPVYANLN